MIYADVKYKVRGWDGFYTLQDSDDRYGLLEKVDDEDAGKLVVLLNQDAVRQLYTGKDGRTRQYPTIVEVAAYTQEDLRCARIELEHNAAYKEWLQKSEEKYRSCAHCLCDGINASCSADGYPVLDCLTCTSYKKGKSDDE